MPEIVPKVVRSTKTFVVFLARGRGDRCVSDIIGNIIYQNNVFIIFGVI